jgi:predicted DNA-binding protein (MmcQ/YjbR family)
MKMPPSSQIQALQKKIRTLCLSFPSVTEGEALGRPVFCVGKYSFAALEEHAGIPYFAVRVGPEDFRDRSPESALLVRKHVAKEGWLLVKLDREIDFDQAKDLLLMSYVAIAPRKMLQALERELTAG